MCEKGTRRAVDSPCPTILHQCSTKLVTNVYPFRFADTMSNACTPYRLDRSEEAANVDMGQCAFVAQHPISFNEDKS